MSVVAFDQQVAAFVAAGNTVEGYPAKVSPSNAIFWNGTGHRLVFGEGVELAGESFHFGSAPSSIVIGDRCRLVGKLIVTNDSHISVGNDTFFNKSSIIQAWEKTKIVIGSGCLFANVKIRTSDTHSIIDANTRKRINPAKDVVIGDNVWLADDVDILKGTVIGNGSIIGSRALVSSIIPENSLAVGVPARVVKTGVTWDKRILPID